MFVHTHTHTDTNTHTHTNEANNNKTLHVKQLKTKTYTTNHISHHSYTVSDELLLFPVFWKAHHYVVVCKNDFPSSLVHPSIPLSHINVKLWYKKKYHDARTRQFALVTLTDLFGSGQHYAKHYACTAAVAVAERKSIGTAIGKLSFHTLLHQALGCAFGSWEVS